MRGPDGMLVRGGSRPGKPTFGATGGGAPRAAVLLLWLWGAAATGALTGCDSGPPKLGTGSPAPSFELKRPSGRPLSFPADVRDEVVVIAFWADWCANCREELDGLEDLLAARRHEGLAVLAVNMGQTPDVVDAFLARRPLSCDVLLDEDSRVAERYGVRLLPATYVVDREGVIRQRLLGRIDRNVIPALVADLL